MVDKKDSWIIIDNGKYHYYYKWYLCIEKDICHIYCMEIKRVNVKIIKLIYLTESS